MDIDTYMKNNKTSLTDAFKLVEKTFESIFGSEIEVLDW